MLIVVVIAAIVLLTALLVLAGYDAFHGVGPGSALDSLSDFAASVVTAVMENKEWSIVIVVAFVAVLLIINRTTTGRR